jgi:hypothetical protein
MNQGMGSGQADKKGIASQFMRPISALEISGVVEATLTMTVTTFKNPEDTAASLATQRQKL